jgi:hypothetical protein
MREPHYETQTSNSNNCGMHVLNHFVGKSIFGPKDAEDAHILCKCFTEAPDLISKLRSIRGDLVTIQSQLLDGGRKDLSGEDANFLRRIEDSLAKLDRAITAVTVMGNEGDKLFENNPLKRHANSIQDIRDCLYSPGLNTLSKNDLRQLQTSLSLSDGFDPVILKIILEKRTGIVLSTMSGPGKEVANRPQADASREKKEFLEALKRNEFPGNANRAIIHTGSEFICIQKLPNGQLVRIGAAGSTALIEDSLARLLGNCSHYQVMYCCTTEDQQKLEASIANARGMEKRVERDTGSPVSQDVRSGQKKATKAFEGSRVAARTFPIHSSRADKLYFATQVPGSNTCGIHALNHFLGKPIFDPNDVEGAHILYKCFTEAPNLISKLRSIRGDLITIQSQLQNDRQKNLNDQDESFLRRTEDSLNQELVKLDRAIAAIATMETKGDNLLENNPQARYADSIRDIGSCLNNLNFNELYNYGRLLNGQARAQFDRCRESIGRTFEELQTSLSPANGLDPVAIRIALEKQAGVTLNVESGPGSEITSGPQADASPQKREFLEALKRNELPGNANRAIVDTGAHFICVRKLPNGQLVLLDSAKREGPITLPAGGLAKLLGDLPRYQIMYCRSAEDQQRLEAFIASAQ